MSQQAATQFLKDMEEQTHIAVVWITPSDMSRARQIIYRHSDKKFTLTDAASFAVMERLPISHAFTFDRHFASYGLSVLSPDQF